MANYNNLKATINANIKANGNEEITGPILNTVLNQAVTTLGAGYQYMGVATPATSPGTPDANVFYIAATPGTYTNFGGKVVADGEVAILKYNGSWAKEVTGAATAAQVTQLGQEVNGSKKNVFLPQLFEGTPPQGSAASSSGTVWINTACVVNPNDVLINVHIFCKSAGTGRKITIYLIDCENYSIKYTMSWTASSAVRVGWNTYSIPIAGLYDKPCYVGFESAKSFGLFNDAPNEIIKVTPNGEYIGTANVTPAYYVEVIQNEYGLVKSVDEAWAYGNAAVRGYAMDKYLQKEYTDVLNFTETGGFWRLNTGIGTTAIFIASVNYSSQKLPCNEGDIFIVTSSGGRGEGRAWAFVDANDTILSVSDAGPVAIDVAVAPKDAAYLLYNTLNSGYDGYVVPELKKIVPFEQFGGFYVYAFRAIKNKEIFIYKDSAFAGLNPIENYDVFIPNEDEAYARNFSKRAIRFLSTTTGHKTLHLKARNINGKVIAEKDVSIYVGKDKSEKLTNTERLNVFFYGDSIIGANNNLIGREFHRFLSTNDAGRVNSDGSIEFPATNICNGKINLIGEINEDGTHFAYNFQVATVLTGKRDVAFGGVQNWGTYFRDHNPFYNPSSSQPDEVGEDGFNKRVDFEWYFRNACPNGEWPGLIYICIGANDIGTPDGWSGNIIPQTVDNVIAVAKKMKSACDAIAGGDSGTLIKFFQHQHHPRYIAPYNNLPTSKTNVIRLIFNNLLVDRVKNGNLGYIEIVDCASKFDMETGYDIGEINTNQRTERKQDIGIISGDGVHMSPTGAYQYADCLIRDFIRTELFD